MRKRLTEDDIAPVVDYIVSESYGSYYYDRVRNSFNVMVLERYLKLMTKIKGSDFLERKEIWGDMQREINSLRIDEQIEEVNTCEALYVNDGHVQHKRFLPIKYFSANGKKQLVSKYGAKRKGKKGGIGGVMLSERYIQGKFFLEKGAQSAKPRIERACDSWLRDTLREAIGALL